MTDKPKATVTAADGGGKVVAPMPFMQNGCFLCGKEIGESDPRQFYAPTDAASPALMLAHTGCLNKFRANGEQWPSEPEKEPEVQELGDVRRVHLGLVKLTYSPHHLTLLCQKAITEEGLKAVIPDLIAALRAAEETL